MSNARVYTKANGNVYRDRKYGDGPWRTTLLGTVTKNVSYAERKRYGAWTARRAHGGAKHFDTKAAAVRWLAR
jgi:hypothetical protein